MAGELEIWSEVSDVQTHRGAFSKERWAFLILMAGRWRLNGSPVSVEHAEASANLPDMERSIKGDHEWELASPVA